LKDFDEIPEDVKNVFLTAADITPEQHIRMQSVFQKNCDSAVSKTINLSSEATREDVQTAYWLAYRSGCKGVTIYRDGSRPDQVLSTKKPDKTKVEEKAAPTPGTNLVIEERPDTLTGITEKIKTGYGNLYVTINAKNDRPFEVFATIGKSGRSTAAKAEAVGRLVSLALRSGVKVGDIVKQLSGIGGEYPVFQSGGLVLSIPDAIARILEKRYLKNTNGTATGTHNKSLMGEKCPECDQTISFEEGCMTCHFCGFTKCG
jgi:ribonucleoside-diphosphate reductase alpha chain